MAISKFRPCIDLHGGKVKQIVGGTLTDDGGAPKENFVSEMSPSQYAEKFRADGLVGGHVIKLGPGNEVAAREALSAWPGGLQIGGGIRYNNATEWLEAGASHVIVTSAIFDQEGMFLEKELEKLVKEVGSDRLVLDLSCKSDGDGWRVAMNRWQTLTNMEITEQSLQHLSTCCSEFLIHAAEVEGLCGGMDTKLVKWLGAWTRNYEGFPITYAGGISSMAEIEAIQSQSEGHVDYTVGSALDLFGGSAIRYQELVTRSVTP